MSANEKSTREIFQHFHTYMNEEHNIREDIRVVVRDLEQKAREILTLLQTVHQPDGLRDVHAVGASSRQHFKEIQDGFMLLRSKVPAGEYYRFNDHWRFVTQRLCFLAAMIVFLESETLITRVECALLLGVNADRETGFHVDLDDFLIGLLQLASELSRLAVNAVTAGDYQYPMRIARFVGELDSGFRLLNLKNDSLRKRYDGLKYDLKKVEEVVYDITIRGLIPGSAAPCSQPDASMSAT